MADPHAWIRPGEWLGMLGGGQLGRMFAHAAQSMGYKVCVLDPGTPSPAGSVAERHIVADYTDERALAELASLCRGVTTEFENVPAASLAFLAGRTRVTPSAQAVEIAQDRSREKAFIRGAGLETARYANVTSAQDLSRADRALFPGILKSARLGYDGKGQHRVATPDAARAAFESMGRVPCVLEERLALECELSVVVARGGRGDAVSFPPSENRHAAGILDVGIVPARVSPVLAARAREAALAVAEALDYAGVLCVELFVVAGGRLVVNEIAPRPHNSGHYTIDACASSQFEAQVRVLADLPLGATDALAPSVMVNLMGDLWAGGAPDWTRVLGHDRAKLHLYGKEEARPGRKMGHVTCLGGTLEDALATARAIRRDLGIPDPEIP